MPKLAPRWSRPAEIVRALTNGVTYVVKLANGEERTRHISNLLPIPETAWGEEYPTETPKAPVEEPAKKRVVEVEEDSDEEIELIFERPVGRAVEILQCIRESNTGPSQPGTQYSESSNTTTPQCSGALGTTNTTATQTTVTTTTTITTAGADAPAGIEVVSSGPAPEGHQQPSNPDDSESDSELYRLSIGELVRLVMREARELRNSRKGMMLLFISKNNG